MNADTKIRTGLAANQRETRESYFRFLMRVDSGNSRLLVFILHPSARSAATCSGCQARTMAFGPGFSRGDAFGDRRMRMKQQLHQARRMAFTQVLTREFFHGRDVRSNVGDALPAVKIGLALSEARVRVEGRHEQE